MFEADIPVSKSWGKKCQFPATGNSLNPVGDQVEAAVRATLLAVLPGANGEGRSVASP